MCPAAGTRRCWRACGGCMTAWGPFCSRHAQQRRPERRQTCRRGWARRRRPRSWTCTRCAVGVALDASAARWCAHYALRLGVSRSLPYCTRQRPQLLHCAFVAHACLQVMSAWSTDSDVTLPGKPAAEWTQLVGPLAMAEAAAAAQAACAASTSEVRGVGWGARRRCRRQAPPAPAQHAGVPSAQPTAPHTRWGVLCAAAGAAAAAVHAHRRR
jgi:hypothetical protein